MLVPVFSLMSIAAWAQVSITINPSYLNVPTTLNYWAGVNTTNLLGVGSNAVVFANADTTSASLAVSGQPAGLTTSLSTNICTNTISLGLNLIVTNVAAGSYPLTIGASGTASYSTNVNFFVVPQWIITNNTASWSSGASWSGGGAPATTDSVYIENQTGGFTNIVDSTRSIQDLIIIGDKDANLAASGVCAMQVPTGVTLSVLGTNGFFCGVKGNGSTRPYYDFSGAGTLTVSNPAADFAIANGASSSSTRVLQLNMTNLNNFNATVSRFGVGDTTLNFQGLLGGNLVGMGLAKTNYIKAQYTDNYSALDFQNSIQYQANGDLASGSANPVFSLGITNGIYADSLGVGREGVQGTGSVGINGGGSTLKFLPGLSNSIAPVASAYFRNVNGGRMSLVAVGVDSGSHNGTKNTKGSIALQGGVVDMLVDQIWLGRNRTNQGGQTVAGAFLFDWGKVNASTVIVGDLQYTNAALASGFLMVGTNGTLTVTNYLELGHTPADPATPVNWPNAASCSGQLTIANGGTVLANQINAGVFTTNSIIVVNPMGSLVVSNSIGQATNSLATLNLNGGNLTFQVTPGVTNAFVTNLLTTTTATKINIASAPAGQSTNILMVYQSANQTPNVAIGTIPAGFNNMQILVDSTAKTVSLVVFTNAPKNLAWRGGQSAQWDHASANWLDLNSLAVTKFTDGDQVTFDDTAGVPTSITVAEDVNPSQANTGILVTNNSNSFVFNNTGSGTIGACTLLKAGSSGLEIDCTTSVGAVVNGGTLVTANSGQIGNATLSSGTIFTNSGTVSGGVSCAGTLQSPGMIDGSLSVQTGGNVVNGGTVSGTLAMQSDSTLFNTGTFSAIGNATVPTNSTLVNGGTIYGSSLTIANGGTLTDTVMGNPAVAPGSINVGSLAINGTFNPGGGGNAIGTTIITDYAYGGSQQGAPNGRVQLNAGSVTTFKVNLANNPSSTEVLSQSTVLGPSEVAKAVNGCTVVITNVGATAFAAGQSFKLFGQYYAAGMAPGNAGLNTTNAYPKIVPKTPGPGLVWDLSQIYASGTIGIVDASTVQFTLGSTVTIYGGSNIVASLSWPANYVGNGWLQQQITSLTNGLGTNWTDVGQSDYVSSILLTNQLSSDTAVFYRFILP